MRVRVILADCVSASLTHIAPSHSDRSRAGQPLAGGFIHGRSSCSVQHCRTWLYHVGHSVHTEGKQQPAVDL